MLRRFSIAARIFLLLGLAGLFMFGEAASFSFVVDKIKGLVVQERQKILLDGRKDKIRLATRAMALVIGQSVRDVADPAERAAIIRRLVEPIRFEDDRSGYFFVYEGTTNVALPPRPELQGKDLAEMADANGVFYVKALHDAARRGGDFIPYVYPKPGGGEERKLSYAEMAPGTDYWVGTGVYIDNIEVEMRRVSAAIGRLFRENMLALASASVPVFLLLAAVALALARSVIQPITQATQAAERIAAGELDLSLDETGRDEASRMTTALNCMARNLRRNMQELQAKRAEAEEKALVAEDALRQTEAANREVVRLIAERVESLQRISMAVAHQLRNPTTIISGYAHLLLRKPELRDRYLDYLDGIVDAASRIEKIAKIVSEYSAIHPGEMRHASLPEAVEAWRSAAVKKAEELGRRVEWKIEAEPIRARLAPELTAMAVGELLTNALEALDKEPGVIRLAAGRSGNDLRIVIEDNGRGMTENELPYLFDPFYTTKAVGVGMGLPKAERAVKELHGELSIHSEAGQGTTAEIRLPLSLDERESDGLSQTLEASDAHVLPDGKEACSSETPK